VGANNWNTLIKLQSEGNILWYLTIQGM